LPVFRFGAGVKDGPFGATGEAGSVLDTGFETEKDAAIDSTALTARLLQVLPLRPGDGRSSA
jgi:hypothetical protein